MQPFNDLLPAEMNPQNEEILTLLRQSHGIREIAAEPDPQAKTQSVALVRQRFQQKIRTHAAEEAELPVVFHLFPPADSPLEMAPIRRVEEKPVRQGWRRGMALLAAALCVALLVGSLLVLTQQHNTRLATVPATGAIYLVTPGWLQKVNAQTGKAIWQAQLPYERVHSVSPLEFPLVSNGAVYVVDKNILSAFRTATGARLWSVQVPDMTDTSGDLFQATPPDGRLYYHYISQAGDSIEALDASSGRLLWHYQHGFILDNVVVSNNVVYASFDNLIPEKNTLVALDASNGGPKWSTTTNAYFNASIGPAFGWVHHASEMVVQGGVVYQVVTSAASSMNDGDYLFAWRADTGALLWHSQNFQPAAFASHPELFMITSDLIAGRDALYIDTTAGLFAFNVSDGRQLWQQSEGGVSPEQVLMKDQSLNIPGNLPFGGRGSPESSFIVAGNTIFRMEMTAQGNYISRLDTTTGNVLARQPVENFYCTEEALANTYTSPQQMENITFRIFQGLMTDTTSYVFPSRNRLDALDTQTGQRLWSLQLVEAGPTVLTLGPL